jgi:aminoglycoside 6'-N-acetyltransferase
MKPDAYTFRPATPEDLPLLRRWLRTPEVVRFWGDPEEELTLLTADLAEPRMVMRIVSLAERPFAYATRAIDTFIGEPDMVGRGHGACYLRLLAERLLAEGAPLVVIDPDADNERARRAYENAGFRGTSVVATAAGPAVLMIFDGSVAPPTATLPACGDTPRSG